MRMVNNSMSNVQRLGEGIRQEVVEIVEGQRGKFKNGIFLLRHVSLISDFNYWSSTEFIKDKIFYCEE